MKRRRGTWVWGVAVVMAAAFMTGGAGAQAKEAAATPAPGKPAFLMGAYEPSEVGYTASEFFVTGEANAYDMADPAPKDGRWSATPAGKTAYATRIVVLRPADSRRFNGTVVVEWLNVSGGADSPAVWLMAHRQMIRAGYAYVAVSAQKVGVDGGDSILGRELGGRDGSLRGQNPGRYAALHHPGDAFSFDIYSQVGRLVRASRPGGGVLGPFVAKHVIAVGESQSAAFLTTYVNGVDPLAKVYDGFLIHSRTGGAARLNGQLAVLGARLNGIHLRPDPRVPVMTFITESDLVGFGTAQGYHAVRQPDGPLSRTWELAGAAHADNYTIAVAPIDTGKAPLETLAAAYAPTTSMLGLTVAKPINNGPQHHYVVQAALDGLERWVRTGKAPHASPRIELNGANPPVPLLDDRGLAKGGIRTPWMDVPTARLSSEGDAGALVTAIFGTSEPFDAATLARLYPGGKAEYLRQFEASLDRTIREGFILPAERGEILSLAALAYPGE